jgi:uncharacterized protein involved in outer membrane biogenesis
MKRLHQSLLIVVLFLVLLLAGGMFALQRWIGSDDFRNRVMQEAAQALGVGVRIGSVDLSIWPLPALVLEKIEAGARSAVTLQRVEVRPAWIQLLQGRVAPATLIVRNAVLPHSAMDALVTAIQKKRQGAERKDVDFEAMGRWLPRRTVLDGVTWVDAKGVGITVYADARLSPDALPQALELEVLKGRLQGARLSLLRDGLAWDVGLQLAGGSVKGRVELQPAAVAGAEFAFKGQLQTRDVEVAALTAPDISGKTQAAQPLSGRLEASTTLSVRTRTPSAMLDVLQTQSTFTVQKAVLHGIDLEKAVKSVGISRGGDTRFEIMSGQVQTRGTAIEFSHLAASSGDLSATGQVSVATNRTLSGRVSVDLGGAVGVPLVVAGTVDEPEVHLTRGAKIGAALGTLLMPGVGTGAGAAVGGKVSEGLDKLLGK